MSDLVFEAFLQSRPVRPKVMTKKQDNNIKGSNMRTNLCSSCFSEYSGPLLIITEQYKLSTDSRIGLQNMTINLQKIFKIYFISRQIVMKRYSQIEKISSQLVNHVDRTDCITPLPKVPSILPYKCSFGAYQHTWAEHLDQNLPICFLSFEH